MTWGKQRGVCDDCGGPSRKEPPARKCQKCINKSKYWTTKMSLCHPEKKAYVGTFCRKCYESSKPKAVCHPLLYAYSKNLCKKCYDSDRSVLRLERAREKKYGVSIDVQRQKLLEQEGKCLICGEEAKVLDHCHATSEFRGFLCLNCNSGLGMFKDNPDFLLKASFYVEKQG